MPQNLAPCSLVQYFEHLTEKEQENIVHQWPMLRTRLSRQKANNSVEVFSNLLASRPDDVKDCLVLLDLMMTLSPSTAMCKRSFSTMNQLKSNVCKQILQRSLVDLMRVRSSDVSTKEYTSGPAITHWILDADEEAYIVKQ
ncbi:hypothetical protein OS493_011482 [Desmophyllum pertusum]|uniref:HAT C-terminal dimerisation domain-containing protein n=1 Tax=Desmophyllum pertusum TaxID=174260 RepID=A0A9X0CLN7_9CNID|nr:hypothetical protein OS493_011482 [Desmophyllum pertusum]